MLCVWSGDHRMHDPDGELHVGVRMPCGEVPQRAERIREVLAGAGNTFVDARRQPHEHLLAVHDPALVAYLAGAWRDWVAAGLTIDPGQNRVVPYVFPLPDMFAGLRPAQPKAMAARAGLYCYDTMTLIGPGTWAAARAGLDAALTATELVLAGEPAAYACTRPPGHHATRASFGGSCYLNNAAAAAARLHAGGGGPVAVLDIDAHHGNGTQAIFYDDPNVLVGSVHADPGAGWFPHFLGFEDEEGGGAGAGANRNIPLPTGAGDEAWCAAVAELARWASEREARALVVALGVDAAGEDPDGPLAVTAAGLAEAGRTLGALGLPTVVVQEGGHDLDTIGTLVLEALAGIDEGLA